MKKPRHAHKYVYRQPGTDTVITVLHNSESAVETVKLYMYYLLAVSFHETTIIDAFRAVVEEHDDFERESKDDL